MRVARSRKVRRTVCASVDINPAKLGREDHDIIAATRLAVEAVREGNRGHYNESMADTHYLAGLLDLAAKKEALARAQFALAAQHDGYDPEPRFGSKNHLGSRFLDEEWSIFGRNHPNFDYQRALEIFREEQRGLY